MSFQALVQSIQSLNAADAFRPRFDDAHWAEFGGFLKEHRLRSGDTLIRHRDLDRNMFLVESGSLQVYVPDGARRPVAILRSGAVVGEPSLFGTAPRMAQVDAMAATVVWVLTRSRFEEILARQPLLGIEVMRSIGAVMAERMRANLERGQPLA